MVYYRGEYHLFYQHNPGGWAWGNLHWGHAVSRDAVHWKELGDALAPDRLGMVFSGSAAVDRAGTTGLGDGREPPMVIAYTAAGEASTQCLASSTDGRAFARFGGNPVHGEVSPGSRDPKILWHEASASWVVCLYAGIPTGGDGPRGARAVVDTFQFFRSPDLRRWTAASRVSGLYECPDLFELPLDGDPARPRWVLTDATSGYLVGAFDGAVFTPGTPKLAGHLGRGHDFYAPQTFSDMPAGDGRRIQIGWLKAEAPGMPFNQAMSLPMELGLVSTPGGPRLTRRPIAELEGLRRRSVRAGGSALGPGDPNPLEGAGWDLVEIRAAFEADPGATVAFTVRGISVVVDPGRGEIRVGGHCAPAPARGGRQELVIFADILMIEVFASGGLAYLPVPFVPGPGDPGPASVRADGGRARFHLLDAHELVTIWPTLPE
jgi:sucrose-6-phosphate hydrolase SacC (GH32 family)